jgi:hypothetical protein
MLRFGLEGGHVRLRGSIAACTFLDLRGGFRTLFQRIGAECGDNFSSWNRCEMILVLLGLAFKAVCSSC